MDETDRVRVVAAYDAAGNAHGFVALSFTRQDSGKLLEERDRARWRNGAPLVYLDFLAVKRSSQRKGVGANLLIEALTRSFAVSEIIPVYGVCLTSLNERTTAFYERMGFRPAPDENVTANPLMVIPILTVRDMLGA